MCFSIVVLDIRPCLISMFSKCELRLPSYLPQGVAAGNRYMGSPYSSILPCSFSKSACFLLSASAKLSHTSYPSTPLRSSWSRVISPLHSCCRLSRTSKRVCTSLSFATMVGSLSTNSSIPDKTSGDQGQSLQMVASATSTLDPEA